MLYWDAYKLILNSKSDGRGGQTRLDCPCKCVKERERQRDRKVNLKKVFFCVTTALLEAPAASVSHKMEATHSSVTLVTIHSNKLLLYTRGQHSYLLDSINQPTRCNSFTSLLLDVYAWLDMFRASPRPSSGAYNCTRSFWFYHWREAAGAL